MTTAIMLAVFSIKYSARKSVWNMLAQKARRFLKKECGAVEDWEQVGAAAAAALGIK